MHSAIISSNYNHLEVRNHTDSAHLSTSLDVDNTKYKEHIYQARSYMQREERYALDFSGSHIHLNCLLILIIFISKYNLINTTNINNSN